MSMRGLVFVAVAVLSGCGLGGSGDGPPPEQGEYTLFWHADPDTDYGPVVPGFKTLESCRHAGVSMTMQRLRELGKADEQNPDVAGGPWFECGEKCGPAFKGSFLRVCRHVPEYRGAAAVTPRMSTPPS